MIAAWTVTVQEDLGARWRGAPLFVRFMAAGAAVMLSGMALVGGWVTERIEQAVVDNTAMAAALYADSFVAPLSHEFAAGGTLSYPAQRALEEVLRAPRASGRIVSFKIWDAEGRILYATDPGLVGRQFEPSAALRRAWAGEIAASFGELGHPESAAEAAMGVPLLEVYSPVRAAWSGEIVAVAEFYETADRLEDSLARARRASWLLVAAVFAGSFVLLGGIVRAGGSTIEQQKADLRRQVAVSRAMAEENERLRRRATGASARAASQTERKLRRASADLHDGPAQYVALAALRLGSVLPDTEAGRREASIICGALDKALGEIRAISRGLSLPELERLSLAELARRAIESHPGPPRLVHDGADAPGLDLSARLCLFRFLQEGLSNAARHASGADVEVALGIDGSALVARVRDNGPGFDPSARRSCRPDGGDGLPGLRDRAESIGGCLDIVSAPGAGTELVLTLPIPKVTSHDNSHHSGG